MNASRIATFIKFSRQRLQMTQIDLAQKSGVGLRFIREMEQGKESLRLDKVNQVLSLFGHTIAPVSAKRMDPFDIFLNYVSEEVTIHLVNKTVKRGSLEGPIYNNEEITGWRFRDALSKSEESISHNEIHEITKGLL